MYETRGELGEAERLYRQSLAIREALGDVQGKGATLHALGHLYQMRGELGEAERLYRQVLEIMEALGDVQGKGATLHALAGIYVVRGELGEAERLYRQSLEIRKALGDVRGKGATLAMLGQLLAQQGRLADGRAMVLQALSLLEGMGAAGDAAQVREILQAMGGEAVASAGELTPQVYQALLLVGQAVFAARRGAALDAQAEQELQAMQQAGGVWVSVAAFFRQAAQPGQALPVLPEGLPAPLRAMLEDFLSVW
ncbi:MAG: tetratricopeptide repeat protein [Anaerolinea sp.]|nr:tetratricopeptide repeat protein [Anaerolinea sp.]